MSNIRSFEGMTPVIDSEAWVDEAAVVIGDVEIGTGTTIWPNVTIRGDIHRIRIGSQTSIQDGSTLHVTHPSRFIPDGHPLIIGDEITVGHNVTLHGCNIGNQCLIGMGSIVLDGAVVHPRTMLGAGSLVPGGKELESGYLWMGSPVKRIRKLTAKELEFLGYAAGSYTQLGQRYKKEQASG